MGAFVHPTAIVEPGAQLEEEVEVGPYSIIGKNVRIGRRTRIGPGVLIEGWTSIGADCIICKGTAIGGLPQDTHFKGGKSFIKIGDRNIIREYVTIHRGTKEGSVTQIGNDNFIMAYSHIAHNCIIEDGVIIANLGTLAGYVTVEKKAVIGGLSGIHQYVRIGAYSIVGGCSKVVKDVPPYTKADGHPATLWGLNTIGLRRANFPPRTTELLKKAYKILFRSNLNTSQALRKIENGLEPVPEIQHLCDFIRNSQRGICKERQR
ncbi:acyl-[acyl-carrier-protein]--UDP-N-acetylglucosamine O-acyltransferase [Candidatus Aerophobetes bacterium]|uniref:Acyl-[acyl-carrier-protein]--UDP-N-acetylglucosamine O-acyltransferase n=1 Tax=Aerophobetes bacterium TaxID=2030807 RepID=A0A497E435_UNCAE|nr:MAG: acyl-[acyl-carrier-protein]--UDP-N-acetylglucosamine O-acyltransferase [Candidatus Aerophobetes bacterium]